jgi:DDE_Tnp_1-associated
MANSIEVHFGKLPDPRRAQGRRHSLSDMIVIAVTAVICAADSWADVRDFGKAKLKWFKTFLELPHGIPSQDTFERVFSRLDPDAFERCFVEWTQALSTGSGGQLVAIDGKRIRRSFRSRRLQVRTLPETMPNGSLSLPLALWSGEVLLKGCKVAERDVSVTIGVVTPARVCAYF